jgi:hypothetical protein
MVYFQIKTVEIHKMMTEMMEMVGMPCVLYHMIAAVHMHWYGHTVHGQTYTMHGH